MRMNALVALSVLCLAAVLGAQPPVTPPPHADDDALLKDFQARVSRYMDLRNQHSSVAPKPTNSPQQLHQAKKEMAARIQTSRANAPQGEIFSPPIADYFRRQIAATLNGPTGKRVRASLRGAEPDAKVPLKINTPYPEHVPLQSTPPTLLLNLPKLPRELEYRIVGRALVLRDIEPNLIVDFISDALPPQAQKQVQEK
jgi:hypothetical protein